MSSIRKRSGTQLEQRQSDLPRPPVPSFCSEEEEVPFLQDDWWASSFSATGIDHIESLDSVIEPFLQYPNESQNTMKGICPESTPAAATPNPGNHKCPALGVSAKGKPISSRESHILSERQRRKGMNHLFSALAALLPENTPKGDKTTIITQIISYIQSLQEELEQLSKKRALQPRREETLTTSTVKDGTLHSSLASPNVVFSICGPDVFVNMSADSGHNLLRPALTTLQQHRLDVLDGNISSSSSTMFYYFHAKVLNGFEVPGDLVQTALQRLPLKAVNSSLSAAAST